MPPNRQDTQVQRSAAPWLMAIGIFSVLATITLLLWRQESSRQTARLLRHTEDVCIQSSRRLQIFVESHLNPAAVFARRWATHESRDFSEKRFVEFASVLVEELPGYNAIGLIDPGLGPGWVVPENVGRLRGLLGTESRAILEDARRLDLPMLSRPVRHETGYTNFFAALPLQRGAEFLGYLVVDFRADALLDQCFHQRIRSEFLLRVEEEGELIFCSEQAGCSRDLTDSPLRVTQSFPVRNRTWRLTMVAREAGEETGWSAGLALGGLGLLLSVALGGLSFLLLRRLALYREARDRALLEVAERRKAEESVRASESRYRDVFNASSDGLFVLDEDKRVLEANHATYALLGLPPDELNGRPFADLFSSEHLEVNRYFLEQLERISAAQVETEARHRDGRNLEVHLRGTRLKHQGGARLLVAMTDLSERRRARRRQALLSRKVLVAQEEERARLSRELHDELGQLLTALRLELGWLQKAAIGAKALELDAFVNSVELIEKSTEELRRICRGLRPPLLDDLGLEPAVNQLIDEFRERTGIEVDLELKLDEPEPPLPLEIGLCAYRIIQESLTNVSRHADAHSMKVSVLRTQNELVLSAYDDGRGFDPDELENIQGVGLEGMRERANLVSGSVEIRSAPDQGTRVTFRVPLDGPRREGS